MTTPTHTRTTRVIRGLAAASALALSLTACANGVTSQGSSGEEDIHTFVLANGAQAGTPHEAVQDRYIEMLEERSEGRIAIDRTDFQVICPLNEIAECVSDGRADLGTTINDYTPHMLPSMSVISIIGMNTDMQAAISTMYDVHQEYEPVMQDLEENNLHFGASWPVGTLFIGSQEPVETIDDLDGLNARAAGPVTQKILSDAGINVSAITAAETYEALQRGVIDSVASALDFATQYAVAEQVPHWVDPGLGQYTAYGMWWNRESYNSLPDDLQQIVDEVTDELNYGEAMAAYNQQIETVCDAMIAHENVESFTRWDEAETQRWNDAIGNTAEELWLETVATYNFDDAEEYLAAYQAKYAEHSSESNVEDGAASCVDRWQEHNG